MGIVVYVVAGTLVNASDPADIRKANAVQDQLKVEATAAKPYAHANYDSDSYKQRTTRLWCLIVADHA